MNIVAYGGGTNSTAMLIGLVERGETVDLILFADTGGEKPHTYDYVSLFSDWLASKGFPAVVTVKTHLPALEANCIANKELPSIAYGFKSCSDKWKIRPVDKYIQSITDGPVIKLIGIDADEPHRAIESKKKWYQNNFPLLDWDWGRDECIEAIERVGLPLPGKSACFFCPSSKAWEIRQLKQQYPELADRAIKLEQNAQLTSIKGLGRNWAWRDLLATDDMFNDMPEVEIACGCYDG